jgi:hypothetical protein
MKKSVFFLITVLVTVSVLNGNPKYADKDPKKESKSGRMSPRRLEGNSVSVAAKENFEATYKWIPVKWARGNFFDEATFTKDGKMQTAYYDSEGKLVGITTESSFSELPAKGQREIKSRYKDYSIGKIIFYDDNVFSESDMLLYGLQFDDTNNYFVEMSKGTRKIVLRVTTSGYVEFFTVM